MKIKKDFLARFSAKFSRLGAGDCWEWSGARNDKGYGQFDVGGKRVGAHRLIYQMVNGPIPDGMVVMHFCDNRACVNPSHLRVGTPKDNTRDMLQKGRNKNPAGESSPVAVLTSEMAIEIVRLHKLGLGRRSIANAFDVSVGCIRSVVIGRTWSHVTGVGRNG